MGTKTNEAATAYFTELVDLLVQVAAKGTHSDSGAGYIVAETFLDERCRKLSDCIKEYDIGKEVVQHGLQQIYDELMKHKRYEAAAAFAKKYDL